MLWLHGFKGDWINSWKRYPWEVTEQTNPIWFRKWPDLKTVEVSGITWEKQWLLVLTSPLPSALGRCWRQHTGLEASLMFYSSFGHCQCKTLSRTYFCPSMHSCLILILLNCCFQIYQLLAAIDTYFSSELLLLYRKVPFRVILMEITGWHLQINILSLAEFSTLGLVLLFFFFFFFFFYIYIYTQRNTYWNRLEEWLL